MNETSLNTCRICDTSGQHSYYTAHEMMFGRRTAFNYFHCSTCGCLQILDIPENLGDYYGDNYYSHTSPRKRHPIVSMVIRMRDRHAVFGTGWLGRLVENQLPNLAMRAIRPLALQGHASILDVGCGSGHLLQTLAAIGFKNLTGIDPFTSASINYESGVQVLRKNIEEIQGAWDVIMFHHSLEHAVDPYKTLLAAKRNLADSGCCIVRVPLVDSYAWECYGVNWCQLDAPRHLHLLSRSSLQTLAQRVGLRVDNVVYDSTEFQFWGSEQYKLNIPMRSPSSYFENPKASIFTRTKIKDFRRKAADLNAAGRGDQAVFYLRHA